MKPYTISCTTCQARLKVRNHDAIGKILSCPKCGSMVLVGPPDSPVEQENTSLPTGPGAGVSQPPTSVSVPQSSGNLLDSTFDEIDTLLDDVPPVQKKVTPQQHAAAAPQPRASERATAVSGPSPAKKAPPAAPRSETPSTGAAADADSATGKRDGSDPRRKKQTSKIAAAVVAPLVAPDVPKPAPQVAREPVSSPTAATTTGAPASPNVGQTPALDPPPAEMSPPLTPGQWESPATQFWRKWGLLVAAGVTAVLLIITVWGFLTSQGSNARKTESPVPPATATKQPSGQPPGAASPRNATDPAGAGEPRAQMSPTASDPRTPPTATEPVDPATSDPGGDRVAAITEPASELPDDRVRETLDPPTSTHVGDNPLEPPIEDEPFGDMGFDVPLPETPMIPSADLPTDPTGDRPAPPIVDVEARLADPIPLIEYRSTPLKKLLEDISQFSTIPITLDPDSLLHVGIKPDRPVAVREQDTTVRRVLANVLGSCRLTFRVTSGQLRVVKEGFENDHLRRVRLDVVDLCGEDPEAVARLANMIRVAIGQERWQETGGEGELSVAEGAVILTHTNTSIFRALELCERLRVARGLALRSRYDAELFQTPTRTTRAGALLDTTIRMNFGQPTALTQILSRVTSSTGGEILVDWEALAKAHWAPPAEITMSADDVPLEAALDDMLDPMGLTYRVVGPQTLQITTPWALQAHREMELYPVDDLVGQRISGKQLVQRLQRALGAGLFQGPDAIGSIQFDASTSHLIVCLPQPYQRRLEAILAAWRSGS